MDPFDRAITRSDPVLRWYLASIPLRRNFQVRIAGKLLWLLIVPLILCWIFWSVTSNEVVFGFDSMDLAGEVPRYTVAGLGFLGDTMVWPFFFLVPWFLVLLRGAIGKTVALLHGRERLVRPEVLTDPRFNQICWRTYIALCYGSRGWASTVVVRRGCPRPGCVRVEYRYLYSFRGVAEYADRV